MPTLPIDLNIAVQDALQTRAEVIASAQAAGHAVEAADVVMDPSTGTLRLLLQTADSLNPTAVDAIQANNGAAKVLLELPDSLFTNNITDTTFVGDLSDTFDVPLGRRDRIDVVYHDPAVPGFITNWSLAGRYQDPGTGDEYQAFVTMNPNPMLFTATLISIENLINGEGTLTINSGDIVVVHDSGSTPIVFSNPLVIEEPATNVAWITMWVTSDGRVFKCSSRSGAGVNAPNLNYADAWNAAGGQYL